MATQAAIFAETIAGMKKAVKRKAYDSDSDSSIDNITNRGNKLRKKARFVHEGQLAAPTGPLVYKRKIEHAGFQREIISRNPPLVDEDGYEVDSDDDDERVQAAAVAAAELDPYADIRLENLLIPLTAASDLPEHPTLSKPFTSKELTELTRQAGLMVQRENAALWRIKHLLTRLSGDNTWMPCSTVETGNEFDFFLQAGGRDQEYHSGQIVAGSSHQGSTGTLAAEGAPQSSGLSAINDISEDPVLATVQKLAENSASNPGVVMTTSDETAQTQDVAMGSEDQAIASKNGSQADDTEDISGEGAMDVDRVKAIPAGTSENGGSKEIVFFGLRSSADGQEEPAQPHRMRTRAQAQAASDNNTATSRTRSASPDSEELNVHPYFLAPRSSFADRDLGLPAPEAEETRRLLQLYVQKQEEACRGLQKLYIGLMEADQRRKLVLKWCKAEGHVGVNRDMSDGEDWYDKEEWGLEEDLKKGQDEEEEDAATTAKKTRTRRQ